MSQPRHLHGVQEPGKRSQLHTDQPLSTFMCGPGVVICRVELMLGFLQVYLSNRTSIEASPHTSIQSINAPETYPYTRTVPFDSRAASPPSGSSLG